MKTAPYTNSQRLVFWLERIKRHVQGHKNRISLMK